MSSGEVAAQPTPTPTVNQDSIAAAERARQDSIAAVERARQDSMARVEQMRRDSIAAAERHRQDSIAAVEKARQDSIARADSIAAAEAMAIRLRRWAGGPYIGIAGGATLTTGNISNSTGIGGTNPSGGYGTGWNITVPIGWDFTGSPFGLRVDGSWNRLSANSFTSGATTYDPQDLNVAQLNADVKLRLPLGRTWSRFYVLGGGGAAKFYGYNDVTTPGSSKVTFGNSDTEWGWNAGAGFNFNFGRMTGLFLEARYMAFTPSVTQGFPYNQAHTIPIILGIQF